MIDKKDISTPFEIKIEIKPQEISINRKNSMNRATDPKLEQEEKKLLI